MVARLPSAKLRTVPDPVTGLPVLGIVGGGQLARMTHQAAIALGLSVRVLADEPADSAAQVSGAVSVGDYRSIEDLRAFAASCDVVTFDHEHVPGVALRMLVADGVAVRPGPHSLAYTQDKQLMRERLEALGVAVPAWRTVETADDIVAFGDTHGWPVVAKARSGGYDGRGVWMLDGPSAAQALVSQGNIRLYVEQRVAIVRELAAVLARRPSGDLAAWPVVETVQSDGICVEVIAPAPALTPELAQEAVALATRIAEALDVIGVLAVELFETADGLVVNELAMRPHNSGHWSIDGSVTSQFEQHARAVLDLPLGDPSAVAPYTVMVNLLGADTVVGTPAERLASALADPRVRVHLYGKGERPGRKLGHVTVTGDELGDTRARARLAVERLRGTG
ncbi:MAG: 5-(carboxyamino)imidazole ribonucleotide synthase [Frankiaceae bacterium]|nr:5-(carboxyamino)imidazole ribonucleotide synthase [Frankiaceae bacterium]